MGVTLRFPPPQRGCLYRSLCSGARFEESPALEEQIDRTTGNDTFDAAGDGEQAKGCEWNETGRRTARA
ncbi:hypothetical protein [Streptomyces sp. TRM70350]|uniref:hypothetical protein n=1 Tax=Streptomyces sp. TRM70350 TaxID=2856165 RepID=UPI001C47AD12|nr:hypothetical protein [Streptomyces sp. TRM70350]